MSDPHKITILQEWGGSGLTVISEDGLRKLTVADGLCYDEMLGYIARLLCPTESDGTPSEYFGKPLFLSAPVKATKQDS